MRAEASTRSMIALGAQSIMALSRQSARETMRECPPQIQSPAMSSQGLAGWPFSVARFRHVTVTHAGLLSPASG